MVTPAGQQPAGQPTVSAAMQVRGSTTHYEAVANAAAGGTLSASQDCGVPIIFGVLTTETMEQASSQHKLCPVHIPGRAPSMLFTCACTPRLAGRPAQTEALSCAWSANTPCELQAMDRAGGKLGNKGAETAITALETANVLRELRDAGKAAEAWF